MLKIQEIREIIKLIDQSSIEKFTFESDGTKIKLEKGADSTKLHQLLLKQHLYSAGSSCRTTSKSGNS